MIEIAGTMMGTINDLIKDIYFARIATNFHRECSYFKPSRHTVVYVVEGGLGKVMLDGVVILNIEELGLVSGPAAFERLVDAIFDAIWDALVDLYLSGPGWYRYLRELDTHDYEEVA